MRNISSPFDLARYSPPGVYVDPQATPPLLVTGIDPTVLCIIGRGVGYRTYTESVSFASNSTVRLTKRGVDPASVTVSGRVTDPAQAGLSLAKTFSADEGAAARDYSLDTNTSAGADASVTTISRTTGGRIENAYPDVLVSYHYTDADYHSLHAFDDFDALTSLYGPSFDLTTGEIASPLTLAAQCAIVNGANYLYTIALSGTGTLQQQFNNAYNLLSGNFDANVIIPLFENFTTTDSIQGIVEAARGFVESTLGDGHTRIVMCGYDQRWSPTIAEQTQMTNQLSDRRVVSIWPNQINIYDGVTNRAIVVDGFYLAAAIGGLMSKNPPQEPITRKFPRGLLTIPSPMLQTLTKSVKNQLASSGWCVVETDRQGRPVVRHGLTTAYTEGVMAREINLVRAQDSLYNLIQETLTNAGIIGTVITNETPLTVKGIVSGALELAKAQSLIYDYLNLKVRQQAPPSGDPTVIEVKFAYKPSFPLNYVVVSFSVDTSTGAVDAATNLNAGTDFTTIGG